ncbi:dTDP-4-dehydrorhamnose reductase [Candidatus Methylomicrobium oryzae]|jgi:dTDP-4-dehydrorhamnose reductase|uniref:dTDP-4-dehydrorhamnose reductase n=1 Tax=Candidatus Methylomicrobium oryzae TaxID=2802053 RepID=UPI0019228E5C|nr:dTDP-4-dehydrorhamnose reductase [Methylomicrobium sp. RS1]MBL1265315.1 dTDP-4-dehydrorhamnose reductase [Methylomicrobium sp. RS1]
MKILLFGKDGQVGRELQRTLLPLGEVFALNRQDADLQNLTGLDRLLQTVKPDLIVNAAAYTAVDKAETDSATAFRVNAEAVEAMAGYAFDQKVLLVHYSTDYVFDGQKPGAFVETDAPHPLGVYGLSKRKGEEAIEQSRCNALIFRTSWVFSAHGNNFIKTILRLAKEKNSLNIVADQFGAPTSAELIADVTALAIAGYRSGRLGSGIYHLTANGEANWHRFACHIVDRALANGLPLQLDALRINAITTEDYPVPARRPKNSRLDTSLLSSGLGLQLPDWTVHANRTIDQLTLSPLP